MKYEQLEHLLWVPQSWEKPNRRKLNNFHIHKRNHEKLTRFLAQFLIFKINYFMNKD